MRNIIFRIVTVTPLVVVISVIIIGNGITIDFPTIAFAIVTEQQFTAKLFGEMEVPSIETNATGLAEFKPKLNENAVAYSLNVTDIDNVTAAYINSGEQGQNGPIVVTLFQPDTPTQKMVSGLLSEGNITSANFEGPLASKQLSDLLNSMDSMGIYVNVHTTQYPDGEIRGQISNSTSGMMMK